MRERMEEISKRNGSKEEGLQKEVIKETCLLKVH
jgi:hypothetical protein